MTGEPADVAKFVRDSRTEEQPLSFNALVPMPDQETLEREWTIWRDCGQCAATGKRPYTEDEAAVLREQTGKPANSSLFFETREEYDRWAAECGGCNGCAGRGLTDSGGEGWYRWALANWGTKWDASFDGPAIAVMWEGADLELSVETNGVSDSSDAGAAIYKFNTAWSPPSRWAARASEITPLTLKLQFGEPGMGYAGIETYVGGVLIDSEELDVDEVLAPEEQWY